MKGVLSSPGSELPGYSQMSLTGHAARADSGLVWRWLADFPIRQPSLGKPTWRPQGAPRYTNCEHALGCRQDQHAQECEQQRHQQLQEAQVATQQLPQPL